MIRRNMESDVRLNAEQLQAKYEKIGPGEHPHWTKADWVASADPANAADYWDWLETVIWAESVA